MSTSTKEMEETGSAVEDADTPASDGWLSWLLLALFLLICLFTWWMVHRSSLHGAPAAPVGTAGAVSVFVPPPKVLAQ